jgi:hypothetical protein
MKKEYFISLVLLCSFLKINGQTPILSAGGWRTSNTNTFTKITGSNNLDTKIYRLDCTSLVDASILQFRIFVDGLPIQATFQEGSYVVVEGKEIAVEQVNQGTMAMGTWTILQQPELAATNIPWNYYPSLSNDLLVASLKTEQEFLISINRTSYCTNTSFIVFIDGQPVKDRNNNTIIFLEGSTIYAKGKSIVIRATGTCTNNNPITGDLKIKK